MNNRVVHADDGTGILNGLLNEAEVINLQYNQNNLAIDYKALNFINPGDERGYAYSLEGYDKEWESCGENADGLTIPKSAVPAPIFFMCKACRNDGGMEMRKGRL